MILRGKIATLRPLQIGDAAITLKWRQSERAKYLQRGAQNIKEQQAWIVSVIPTDDLNFIIEYQNLPVGMIALQEINHRHKTAVLGRLLIGEAAKVGSAPVTFEAELLLCDYLFNDLKFHKLYGDISEDNIAMIKTRMYLGYKKDGVLRDQYIYDGVYKNAIAVSLLEDEYREFTRRKLIDLIGLFGKVNTGKQSLL